MSRVLIRQESRRRIRTRDTERVDPARPRANPRVRPSTRARVDTTARAMAYVTRDGATRATRPFALAACVWGAVDVVDAFFRTLLVDGYAETYAGRGPTRDATRGRVAATRARDGGGGGANVRGFANVRTIDHAAPTAGG